MQSDFNSALETSRERTQTSPVISISKEWSWMGQSASAAVNSSHRENNHSHRSKSKAWLAFSSPSAPATRKYALSSAGIVNRVLLLQIGPIDAFELVYRKFIAASDVDRWILHLTRKSLKEFTLTKSRGSTYSVSSCLFSCQELVHLDLHNCSLKPPLTFKGFRRLKSLRLEDVSFFAPDGFEKLIGCCPLLERLTLIDLNGITHLKIDAPNLQFLEVQDIFEDVKVDNTLNLVDVSIDFGEASSYCSNLLKYFVQLPLMESLTIKGFLSKCAIGASAEELPNQCRCLKFLSIDIRLNNLEEILAAICFLRSSPALQELYRR